MAWRLLGAVAVVVAVAGVTIALMLVAPIG